MAGIAGIQGKNSSRDTVQSMLHTLQHRGPDQMEIQQTETLCAGVISADLSAERGNGFAQKGNVAVWLDGDIYNERAQGQSDAELVLDMYGKHGRTFPGHLKGVFACAVQDGEHLMLVRDNVGVRPLYYGKTDSGQGCFASEMKALVGIAAEVHELHPSTSYTSGIGVAGYVSHYPAVCVPNSPSQAADALRQTLLQAVERRMQDGAVGACLLSGGLDSSIIAAIAHQLDPKLPMITVGVGGDQQK
jgi:asparagine synthase (glutamine-hydrolysing)